MLCTIHDDDDVSQSCWGCPAIPSGPVMLWKINFPWFGSRDYWQGQVDMLIEQTEAMQAPALVA
jgi:hypothetical protein